MVLELDNKLKQISRKIKIMQKYFHKKIGNKPATCTIHLWEDDQYKILLTHTDDNYIREAITYQISKNIFQYIKIKVTQEEWDWSEMHTLKQNKKGDLID